MSVLFRYSSGRGLCGLLPVLLPFLAIVGEAHRAPAQEAASRSAPPASLPEAQQVIDLRTFPTLERGDVFFQTPTKVGYNIAKPDLAADVQFYRTKLTEAGWKIDEDKLEEKQSYGMLTCSKQGFAVSVNIVKDPNTGKMNAFVENYGNVDARTLLRIEGAEPDPSQFNVGHFSTKAKPDAVAKTVQRELAKFGWREVVSYGGRQADESGMSHFLQFLQRGSLVGVHINGAEGAATTIMFHASLQKFGPPIMPEVSGDVQFLDDPFLRLIYATKATPADVLAFYRKELPGLGWTIPADGAPDAEGKLELALTGPNKEPLRLELLAKDGLTHVMIASAGK